MYARVTHYRMKPDSIAAATALLEEVRERIMSLPGMVRFVNVIKPDGSGIVISLTETREQIEENKDRVAAIWSVFAEHLAAPPEAPQTFEVLADWAA